MAACQYRSTTPCLPCSFLWWFRCIGHPRLIRRMVLSWYAQSLRCSIHLTAGASLEDICSCRWPGSLVLLVSLSHCLSVSGVHRTVRSLPVSPHYALSTIQVPIVVPLHWPPSAPQPSGSVLAFAVLAVFCAPDSEE